MRKGIKSLIYTLLTALTISGCDNIVTTSSLPVYSKMMTSVEDLGLVTGKLANPSTLDPYKIGGTDLGIPYYDETREQMYLLFGDTFEGVNNMTGDWRSQTVGISKDFNLSDGLTFDSFISDSKGRAVQIIESMHDSNGAGGERTCIPTGGIEVNGVHYVFYMSIREWLSVGWDVNFCALAKSTDAQNFTILKDMYWTEEENAGKENTELLLEQPKEEIANHEGDDFLQIFPYRKGEYIYLFGLTSGRFGGCKLGRVKPENIESFQKYEYFTGKDENGTPLWVEGTEGLKAIKNNDDSYIVEPQVGELSVCFNAYLNKYVMSYYSKNKIVMRTSYDLIDWTEIEIITTSEEFIQLYGGFSHELYMEENGKVMYFLISQYMNKSLSEEGYNVRLLKVKFN